MREDGLDGWCAEASKMAREQDYEDEVCQDASRPADGIT